MSRKSLTLKQFLYEEPVCKPLDTYEDIIKFLEEPPAWRSLCKELTPHSELKICNMALNSMVGPIGPDRPPTFCHFSPEQEDVERESAAAAPRTLVCHDMANGYHDDSKIDGTSNELAYTFYHWAGIDIFCYFSHHLITIPPVGWINVGHAHGVKVIGTVITEWTEGFDFWEFVLSSESQYRELADALVSIALTLKFDGWLLNVENKVSKPLELLAFVQYLHRRLHEELPAAELVWYDSVTIKGNLNWQNGLNENNKDFFDACDGFFTNYSWKEENLVTSTEMAGERVTDLYIGIDVWGRNFYGGGQFNTAAAVELVHGYGCSLALFAPAWTYEAAERRDADIALAAGLDRLHALLLRERALWGSLWPFLHTRLPQRLPFQTSFCRGHGVKRRIYGEVISPGPWYNLRHQQYQPNSAYGPHGYLLSTPEQIEKVSRHAVIRDGTKGIIKYQSDFEASRMELHAVRSAREIETLEREHQHHDSLVVLADEDPGPAAEPEPGPDHDDSDVNKPSKRNTFKHMFRLKSRRRSSSLERERLANAERQQEGGNEGEHSHHDLKRGWSMREMSVNLHLGQHSGKQLRFALACVPGERACLEPYFEDSYLGGCSLCVHPSDALSPEHRWTRLLHCDFPCQSQLIICVVTKTLSPYTHQYLDVKLFALDGAGREARVSCIGRALPSAGRAGAVAAASRQLAAARALTLYPLTAGPVFADLHKYLLLNQPDFYMSVENSFGWMVRYYVAPLGEVRVTSINLHCGHNEGPILLGHIGICHRFENGSQATSTRRESDMGEFDDKGSERRAEPGEGDDDGAAGNTLGGSTLGGSTLGGNTLGSSRAGRAAHTDPPRIRREPRAVRYDGRQPPLQPEAIDVLDRIKTPMGSKPSDVSEISKSIKDSLSSETSDTPTDTLTDTLLSLQDS